MSDTPQQQMPRVKWLLVWSGLIVLYYPLMSYVSAILPFVRSGPPPGVQAIAFSFAWMVVLRLNLHSDKPHTSEPVRKAAIRKDIGYTILLSITPLVGIIGKMLTGRPSWAMIALYTVIMPLAFALSDFLAKHSGLVEAQRAVRDAHSAQLPQ